MKRVTFEKLMLAIAVGSMKPSEATCIHLNYFGAKFLLFPWCVVHSDSIFAKRHRAEYREAEADPKWKELVAFEYDLFVDNPFETYLDILEVYPSAPSLVTMK